MAGIFKILQLFCGVQVRLHRRVGPGQPGQEAAHRRRQRVRPRGRLRGRHDVRDNKIMGNIILVENIRLQIDKFIQHPICSC